MPHMLAPGITLDNYQILRFIGRGGFGEVWLCRPHTHGDYKALKWIPTTNQDAHTKEQQALIRYSHAHNQLHSPHLIAIEHIRRHPQGLYYIMPLADGTPNTSPENPTWHPLTLASLIQQQRQQPQWFQPQQIISWITPILHGLQTLSDASLVHRDIKPDNILFFNNTPCIADIGLLSDDTLTLTRRGTPGYSTPSWYQGGHPDMYGVAATLYTLLTGNLPDTIGRSAFKWPQQGRQSYTPPQQQQIQTLHNIIMRAMHEKTSERYLNYNHIITALQDSHLPTPTPQTNTPTTKTNHTDFREEDGNFIFIAKIIRWIINKCFDLLFTPSKSTPKKPPPKQKKYPAWIADPNTNRIHQPIIFLGVIIGISLGIYAFSIGRDNQGGIMLFLSITTLLRTLIIKPPTTNQ